MTADHSDIARRALLLKGCPQEFVDEVMARGSLRRYARGETIFTAESRAEHVFIVLTGWVKLFRVSARGGEAVIGVLGPARSIGDTAALKARSYLAQAEAVTACELLRIPATVLFQLMEACPEARNAVMASTLHHLKELVGQVEALKVRSGGQRAAQFILSLVPAGQSGACRVHLPYDKALIARQIGMSPESLSRAFKRLRQQGVRISRREVQIDDVTRLSVFCEVDALQAA